MYSIKHLEDWTEKLQCRALLLEADPDWHTVSQYLAQSRVLGMYVQQQLIAQLTLCSLNQTEAEIKNIAVLEHYRGKGLAKQLIAEAIDYCQSQQFDKLWIKTGNSSLAQMALYQKMGFRMQYIEKNVFLNYPEEIWENGIRCLDQVVLARMLK
ncbi:GNAT family N-acetyltransferase [Acinetobacter larvae]|uniref:N-acetyltransferase domain-containing protein n=1 Tax=Acinetobacter larvae TaxID=1789224 RepID=A0A1B2LX61_9GAMM|nr:GNAT family N-acetyltransferase [Acinetobacter larvae]AOA57521.1 hypothetical protein BFG52_03570 [Acinetobacter larvae]